MDGSTYQTRLAEVWNQTVAALIFDGGTQAGERMGSELLATIDDPSDLAELGRLLVVDGPFGHCMCYGETAIELHDDDGSILAVIGLHHGSTLRWGAWEEDARLVNGRALLQWLAGNGVNGPYENWLDAEARHQEFLSQYNVWLLAMPKVLDPLREQMDGLISSGNLLSEETLKELEPRLKAAFPDAGERAGVLLRWFGSGSGKMTGYPSHEEVPKQFLDQVPFGAIVDALHDGDEATLKGGVRYLAGWHFVKDRASDLAMVPPSLRAALLSQAESSGDEDKIGRARRAFA